MEIFDKHPELKKQLEALYQTRRNEILSNMLETDYEYKKLCNERAAASMELKESLHDTDADKLFEKYSDSLYMQEIYELDALYKQAVYDTLDILKKNELL